MPPPIASLYAGLMIFFEFAIIVWVVMGRRDQKVLLGEALVASHAVHPVGMTNRYPQYLFRSGGTLTTLVPLWSRALL